MLTSELINEIILKVNEEIEVLFSDPENEEIIEDINYELLDDQNYRDMSLICLKAVDRLLSDSKPVKIFLSHLLKLLNKFEFEEDLDLSENLIEHKVLFSKKSDLNDILIDGDKIKNHYLNNHKLLILSSSRSDFKSYIDEMPNVLLLVIMNSILKNYDKTIPSDSDRFIFFSGATEMNMNDFSQNKSKLISYLKLCILCEGKSFHKHYSYTNTITDLAPGCNTNIDFTQYNEILYVLSEYNNSKQDILNKYFLLYTIIENFMYRKPISQIIRSTDDFSIRDFKRFYSEIDSNESKKLGALFSEIMTIPVDGSTFLDKIITDFNTFRANDPSNKLIDILLKIGVSNSNNQISYDIILNGQNHNKALKGNEKEPGFFSKIVYQFRNSILHNTATEFHITHYELSKNEIIVNFFKEILLPNLEKIILTLITQNNSLISYNNNVLLLYKKDI